MSLIRVENAKLSFGAKILFQGITFSVGEGDRIGLVGNNGCGKSSLVKSIMGEHELDQGTVTMKRGTQVGYVSQEIPDNIEQMSCHEFLLSSIPPHSQETDFWKVDVALSELGLNSDLWYEPVSTLSGGWRRLLLIASTTLKDPDLLILDEPTNHLDLGKIFKLEKWLLDGVNLPYLAISHDREFLDKCTNRTLFMREDGVHEYDSCFSTARENLFQADALALRSRQREEAEIKRVEKAAKRLKEWGQRAPQSDIAKKGQALQTRADQMKEKQTSVHKERRRDINLHYAEVSSNAIALVQDTDVCTPDGKKLFHIDRMVLKQGDRVCIMGLNGTGKSIFLKHLIKELEAYEPGPAERKGYWFSPQARLGYLDQHLEYLPEDKHTFSYISETFGLDRTATTRELVNVGFPVTQQNMKIGDMSSGEKARLALLVLKLSRPNFYILDEPTNHLDIHGQEALEEELDDNKHTCVFVSHDRQLVRGAATRYLEIKKGKLVEVDSPEPFFDQLQEMAENDMDTRVPGNGVSFASKKTAFSQ